MLQNNSRNRYAKTINLGISVIIQFATMKNSILKLIHTSDFGVLTTEQSILKKSQRTFLNLVKISKFL